MPKRPGSAAGAAKKRPAGGAGVIKKRPAGAVAAAPSTKRRPAAAAPKTPWRKLRNIAKKMWGVYFEGCSFPAWSLDLLGRGLLDRHARSAVAYYGSGEDLDAVKLLATQREPANVGMHRCYDGDLLETLFGHRKGAYAASNKDKLLPNVAIYCLTPMRSAEGEQVDAHVINVIGYAFDSPEQPDYQYFFPLKSRPEKWEELVERMKQVWRYAFECARRKGLRRVYLPDVGGGNFSGGLQGLEKHASTSYAALKEASLPPVRAEYEGVVEDFPLPRIPDFAFSAEGRELLGESLLVNAWDPWSMVGNANLSDNSLDGFFGRCTAMAVLCWPKTNPHLSWESVGPP